MTGEDKAKKVADRIAERLQSSESANNYANSGGNWDDLQSRLDRMYQDIRAGNPAPKMETQTQSVFTPKAKPLVQITASHPSQERFNVNEAIVDELVEFFEKEKACSFEPNGKPCDHCAMCSSRGF
ncbi:MAG TPA: hypothetical protein VGO50_09835 [Pyrinomonadaceae bacterium]|jgi:hypothetical protein|nr:hypothetical protein [Pyrinomonadaceae bacterium]